MVDVIGRDDVWACGKCGTRSDERWEAEECCETCWKCGLRGRMKDEEGEDCCPCSCGGEHGFCEQILWDESDDGKAAWQSSIDDLTAREQFISMFGKPKKDDDDIFTRSWDSIVKNPQQGGEPMDRRLAPQWMQVEESPNEAENEVEITGVGMNDGDDECCRAAKEKMAVTFALGVKLSPEQKHELLRAYDSMSCEAAYELLEMLTRDPDKEKYAAFKAILDEWDSCSSQKFDGDFTASSDPAEVAWDSIIKEPDWKVNVPYEELSPQQRAAEDFTNRVFRDGIENVMLDDAVEADFDASEGQCCRSLKETINAIPIDTWGMELLHRELIREDWDAESTYSDKNCEEFAAIIETQLEIWDHDWESREEYDRVASTWKHNPPHQPLPRDVDISGHEYDSGKEQLRKDQVRQALMEYNACKQQAMGTDFSQADKDHDMFVASADPLEVAWDSITKIEVIEVDSYEELLIKADIPPFPVGMGGDVTPEQMEWMRTYGQRLDPAMPQRQFAHRGGPFIDKRTKAVYQNPVNPNKVFKLNAGATLPIAFSHALAAMGYPVAPMTPMGEVAFGDDDQEGKIRAIMQDRLDMIPSINEGPRKTWPKDEYFDDYSWQDMFRDNAAGHMLGGSNVPADLAAAWNNKEADTARGRDFLQRQGVNVHQWARDFALKNAEDPDLFKPTYGKDTPENRLVNALNQEMRRYSQLPIQAGADRYKENERMSNIGGTEWEDPLLRFLQFDTSSTLGPNIGLDENGRPTISSFRLRGSPTMRVGTGGYDGPYGPMLKPREEGVTYDARDRAAAKMFGQPMRASSVGFEIDPVYGLPRLVRNKVYRDQGIHDANVLDADTMQPIPYNTRFYPRYSGMTEEQILEKNPHLREFWRTPEGYDIADRNKFMAYIKGFEPYFDDEGMADWNNWPEKGSPNWELNRKWEQPSKDFKMAFGRPDPSKYEYQTTQEAAEALGLTEYADPDHPESYEYYRAKEASFENALETWKRRIDPNEGPSGSYSPTEEEIEAARERYMSLGYDPSDTHWENKYGVHDKIFPTRDTFNNNPMMRYLISNMGKKAVYPLDSARTFNTPGNDDEAMGLFPDPFPYIVDPNNKYPIGMPYGDNGKLPFADARGLRNLPKNFRVKGSNYGDDKGMQPKSGKRVMDLGTGEEDYVSNYGEGGQSDDSGIKYRSGPRWYNPQDNNPNTDFIQTIGALHDSYPLPESTRLAELLANMPDRSLFDNSPKQQEYYDKFMKVFPRDVEFWRSMSEDPAMSNDKAFELFNRLRDYS